MSIIKVDYGDITSGGGTPTIDYDFVKNIVMNNTPTYSWVKYTGQTYANLTEGGVYVDTTTHIIFLYIKFECVKNLSGSMQQLFYLTPQVSNSSSAPFLQVDSNAVTNPATNYALLAGEYPQGSTSIANLKSMVDSGNARQMWLGIASGGLVSGNTYAFYGLWSNNKK